MDMRTKKYKQQKITRSSLRHHRSAEKISIFDFRFFLPKKKASGSTSRHWTNATTAVWTGSNSNSSESFLSVRVSRCFVFVSPLLSLRWSEINVDMSKNWIFVWFFPEFRSFWPGKKMHPPPTTGDHHHHPPQTPWWCCYAAAARDSTNSKSRHSWVGWKNDIISTRYEWVKWVREITLIISRHVRISRAGTAVYPSRCIFLTACFVMTRAEFQVNELTKSKMRKPSSPPSSSFVIMIYSRAV